MLVVIEGLDGSGKSTQVKRLRSYLESRTDNLEYIHFPRYDSPVYGELIGKFLRGGFGSIDSVHPQLVALLYAEDRHGAAPQMRRTLDEGGIVLLDRYVYSNIAYQCAKIDDPQERGDDREYLEGKTDIHEADIEFQKRVREVYVSQCEMDPDFIRIDCRSCDGSMLPPDEIAAAIMATVDGKR